MTASDSNSPPLEPVPPVLADCCGSGCDPCVFDLYEAALERYRLALARWRKEHPDQVDQA
jgi:hypothetical protein